MSERADEDLGEAAAPLRMTVRTVRRLDGDRRECEGRVVQGTLRPGDALRLLPNGAGATAREIVSAGRPVQAARAGDVVTLAFEGPAEVVRGDVIAAASDPPPVADQFAAHLRWSSSRPLLPGRPYWLMLHECEAGASITLLKHRIGEQGERLAARTLARDEEGVAHLCLDREVAFEPHAVNAALGAFVLVDRVTGEAAGTGTVDFALRRAGNVPRHEFDLRKAGRAALLGQRPRCIWFTGLPAAGKSTLANLLEGRLHASGRLTYLLDGDNVRHGLNRDLGFTAVDRVENIRRAAEVARLMVDAGLIVLVSFISPFRAERRMARAMFEPGEFIEIFVDAPLAECIRRDPKGLYAEARRGRLRNFTGLDSPYEPPQAPELRVDTVSRSAEEAALDILDFIERGGP